MARTTAEPKPETMTFRINKSLKAAFTKVAREEDRPAGELLRELVRVRVQQRRRRAFEAEALRQSRACADAARDPHSDEAAVLRELDTLFDDLAAADERS